MRALLLPACLLLLAGCDPLGGGLFVAVNGMSLMAIQRTPPDLAISVLSGRDCSLAHIDHDAPYCTPPEPPPAAPQPASAAWAALSIAGPGRTCRRGTWWLISAR